MAAAAAMSSMKNLPAGFRLNPRDDDLINYFLTRKLKGIPDDSDGNYFIPEHDVYLKDPQDLIALYDEKALIKSNGLECFFFCTLGKEPNRRGINRKIAGENKGFWHRTGEGRPAKDTDKLKWAKRIFSHRVGTHRDFVQTDWVMHEFRLISEEDDQSLVLCRITKKKPKKKSTVSAGKKRNGGSTTDENESHQETSIESCVFNDIITKKAKKNHTLISDERFVLSRITKKPKKKKSPSALKKSKVGSTDNSEYHQETSPESRLLNDITTKNHTNPPQYNNQTPLAASFHASSVHINASEFLPMTPPLSDLITLNDWDMPLHTTMDELLAPSPYYYYYPEWSPSVNIVGVQTPLQDISTSDYGFP